MRLNPAHILVLCTAMAGLTARAEDNLTDTRSTLEKWVETRQLISKTRTDWQTDKESLEQTVALYERELKSIDEQMSKVSTNNAQVAKEMAEAESLKQASEQAVAVTRQFATDLEGRLQKMVPLLPAPLQDAVKKDLDRMPADPANTKMLAAERMQACVGVLNELDKFNNGVSIYSEKRKNTAGEEVAVETVYVGLGAAYFVNDAGDFAGVGTPGASGWEWTVKPELAPKVREAIKIYRSEHAPKFVQLPVTIH